jgi:hypothetical protein
MGQRKQTRSGSFSASSVRLTARREALLHRLRELDAAAKAKPGYRSALILLNRKFRAASPAARLGILEAASFMVNVLERLPLV